MIIAIAAGGVGLLGLIWYLSTSKGVHTCPVGYHADPVTGQCVPDSSTPPPTNQSYLTVVKQSNVNPNGFIPVIITVKDDLYLNWAYALQAPTAYGAKTSSGGGVSSSHTISEIFNFAPGSHTVTVTVTDPAGQHQDSVSFTVTATYDLVLS